MKDLALSDFHFLNREDREMELLKFSAALVFAATFIASFAAPSSASASSVCDYYKSNAPHMYKLVCNTGKSTTKPAGASSTFSSAFNLTSTSLPTEPSSYGLEVIGSALRAPGEGTDTTFALVRGFSKFGTGISTGSNNTFYGDDVLQREFGTWELLTFEDIETAKSSMPNLNIGTSFRLFRFSPSVAMKLGTSVRHNKITASWGGGPALALTSPYLTVGAAVTRERISNEFPPILFSTYQISGRYSIFELEYNQLRNDSAFDQSPVHIFTLTTTIRKLTLTMAQRELDYREPGGVRIRVGQAHFAVQYLFTKHFSAGFLHNYIPGATSLGAQFYL